MINLGSRHVYTDKDGWTIRTKDGKPSAHFEHDVCVKKGQAFILSDYAPIEKAEKANSALNSSYY
jgi:methionyl aminopeptidase